MKRFVAAFLGVADFDAAMKYVIQNNLPLHPEEIVPLPERWRALPCLMAILIWPRNFGPLF